MEHQLSFVKDDTLDLNAIANSTADVSLVRVNGKPFVMKRFQADDKRAIQNVRLQQTFKSDLLIKAVPVEKVFSGNEGLEGILMPYMDGLSGAQFAVHGTIRHGWLLQAGLNALICRQMKSAFLQEVRPSLFIQKIWDVRGKVTWSEDLKQTVKSVAERMEEDLMVGMLMPMGPCHGDLTLSNMIIHREQEIYLFDFLQGFVNSPLQDIAKLLQDFKFGWSFRKLAPSARLKGQVFCRRFMPRDVMTYAQVYSKATWALTLLTIARIAPYVRDQLTADWVQKHLEWFLQQEGYESWLDT